MDTDDSRDAGIVIDFRAGRLRHRGASVERRLDRSLPTAWLAGDPLVRIAPQPREAWLEPDTLVAGPGEALDGARLQPEKRLQLAVLADAVLTVHRCSGVRGKEARDLLAEVDAWLASDASDWPFSFVTVCETLRFDPDYIRRGIQRLRMRLETVRTRTPPLRRDGSGTHGRVTIMLGRRIA